MNHPQSLRCTCPRCEKSLRAAEFIEQFCSECGPVRPEPAEKKVRAA